MLEFFKVRAAHKDPDALGALAVAALFLLFPQALHAYDGHEQLFTLLLTSAFGGRFAVRAAGVVAAGKVAAANADPDAPAKAYANGYVTGHDDGYGAAALAKVAMAEPVEVAEPPADAVVEDSQAATLAAGEPVQS